ncbi:Uncharacterized protein PBTT_09869 [Plasmodiophora brassicae]
MVRPSKVIVRNFVLEYLSHIRGPKHWPPIDGKTMNKLHVHLDIPGITKKPKKAQVYKMLSETLGVVKFKEVKKKGHKKKLTDIKWREELVDQVLMSWNSYPRPPFDKFLTDLHASSLFKRYNPIPIEGPIPYASKLNQPGCLVRKGGLLGAGAVPSGSRLALLASAKRGPMAQHADSSIEKDSGAGDPLQGAAADEADDSDDIFESGSDDDDLRVDDDEDEGFTDEEELESSDDDDDDDFRAGADDDDDDDNDSDDDAYSDDSDYADDSDDYDDNDDDESDFDDDESDDDVPGKGVRPRATR